MGIGTALTSYDNYGTPIEVEHHYIQSDEPEVDNKTFKLKPLTQPEKVKRAA